MKLSEKIARLEYKPEDGKSSQRLHAELVRKVDIELKEVFDALWILYGLVPVHATDYGTLLKIKQLINENK